MLISGLYSCVQHEAVLPPEAVTDDSANTIVIDDDNACHTQIASSPLVDTVLEKITPGNELASLWQDPDHLADLLDEIDQLHDDGLNPEHYAYSPIRQIHARALSGNTLSGCEIDLINHAYITALKDLHYGRVDPVEHRLFWYAKNARKASDPRVILDIAMLGIDQDVSQAFNAARPISKEYRDLRDAYQQAFQAENWSGQGIPMPV